VYEAAGFGREANVLVGRALDAGPDALQRVRVAVLLGLLGDARAARTQLAMARDAFRPDHKAMALRGAPSVEAAIALAAGNGARAIEQSESFEVFKQGRPALLYLSARAHVLDGQGAKALADWSRLARISVSGFWKTVATVGRARSVVQSGDVAAARSAYHEVLDTWKAADADLPLLADVKNESDRLK
jgi:hypothetical protein